MGIGSEEFDGVAAGVYDDIVRDLYSAGLILYSVAARLGPGPTADRLREATAHMDDAIRRLGALVLALRDRPATDTGRFAARLYDTISTVTPVLAAAPSTRLAGPIGDLPEDLVDDLLAVARQALTALAGHAHARTVEVDITVADGAVCLRVAADGAGPPGSPDESPGGVETTGVVRGAHLVAEPHPSGGTRLTWTAPLH